MDYKKIIVGNKYFLFLLVFVFLLVSGIFNVSAFNLEEDNLNNGDYTVYREQIVIGKPVKWVAVVNKTSGEEGVEINIPKNAKGINILKGEKVEETIREVKEGRSNITDEDLQDLFNEGEWEPVVDSKKGIVGKLQSLFSITGNVIGETRPIENGELSVKNNEVFVGFDENVEEVVAVSYVTDAPDYEEVEVEDGKVVVISTEEELGYTDVLAYTTFDSQIKALKNARNIRIVWHENKNLIDEMESEFSLENFLNAGIFSDVVMATKNITQNEIVENLVDFIANDTDGDGYIDYVEWVVPHLSEQSYELIIEIVDAEHLDEDRNVLGNVYKELMTLDNITYEVPDGDFLRVFFEINLSFGNDITIHADAEEGVTVEAYEVDSDELLFTFTNITDFERNRIMFEEVSDEWKQDTFDLKSVGGTVIYDWVVDSCLNNGDCASSQYCKDDWGNCNVNPMSCVSVPDCKGWDSANTCGTAWTTIDYNDVCDPYTACGASDICMYASYSGACTGSGDACAYSILDCSSGTYCSGTTSSGSCVSGACSTANICYLSDYYLNTGCDGYGNCDKGYGSQQDPDYSYDACKCDSSWNDWAIGGDVNTCCGDDSGETERDSRADATIEGYSDSSVACCTPTTDCVDDDVCYASSATRDVDDNGDLDYCSDTYWIDCTTIDHCDPTGEYAEGETSNACSGSSECNEACTGYDCIYKRNTGYIDCDIDSACVSGDCFQVNAESAGSSACDASNGAICDGAEDSDMCVATGGCVYDSNYDGTIVNTEYVASGVKTVDVDNDGDDDYCLSGVWYDCYDNTECDTGNNYVCSMYDCVIDSCNKTTDCSRGDYCVEGYCTMDTTNPLVIFVDPTLSDGVSTLLTSYFFNTTIEDSTLENVIIEWNNTNSTIYMADDDGLVLAMDFDSDGDYADWSGESNDGTCAGDACPTYTSSGKIGGAMMFGGVNDNISVTYDSTLALNEFSVSAWVNLASTCAGECGILGTRFGGEYTFDMKVTSTTIHGDIGDGTSWIDTSADCSAALDPGSWHNIIYTVDSTGYAIYANGEECSRETFASGVPLLMKSGEIMRIGNSAGVEYFNGSIDEVRIFNKVLTSDEISNMVKNKLREPTVSNYCFRGGFCNDSFKDTSNTNGLVLAASFDNSSDFSDWSGEGNDGTNSGSTWRAKGRVGGARSFDGTSSDYLTVSRDNSLEPSSFSLSAWININQNSAYNVLFSKDYTSHTQPYYSYHLRTDSNGIFFGWNDGSSGQGIDYNGGAFATGEWIHVVATFTSGAQKIYIDGTEIASSSRADTITYYATDLIMGKARNFVGYFDGEMDEVRVYDRALSNDEIFGLYRNDPYLLNNYNSSKDDELGTVEYSVNFDEPVSIEDISSNGYTTTNYGSEWYENGFSNGARSFDGTDDYIRADSVSSSVVASNISLFTWMRSGETTAQTMISAFNTNTGGNRLLFGHPTSHDNFGIYNGSSWLYSTGTSFDNRWHHVGFTYDISTGAVIFYLDGYQAGSTTSTLSIASDDRFVIGAEYDTDVIGDFLPGTLDEFKIFSDVLSPTDVENLYNNSLSARDNFYLKTNRSNLSFGEYSYNVYAEDESSRIDSETERSIIIAECLTHADCSGDLYCTEGLCVDVGEPSSYRFELENSTGSDVAYIDDKGDMYLKGSVFESESSLSPPPGSFIIKNNADATIGYIDGDGNLKLLGTIDSNSDLSGSGTKMEFRNSSDNLVAFFDNSGNVKLQGSYVGSYTF